MNTALPHNRLKIASHTATVTRILIIQATAQRVASVTPPVA